MLVQVAVQPEYRAGGGAEVQPGRAPSLPVPLPARQARQKGAVRAGGAAGEAGGRAGPAEVTCTLHGCGTEHLPALCCVAGVQTTRPGRAASGAATPSPTSLGRPATSR